MKEFSLQRQKIEPLVQARALKAEVSKALGSDYKYYSRGATNWIALQEVLKREPKTRYVEVREGLAKWPHAMFYSTPDMTTWVFLDDGERAVSFYIGTQ